ncbi:MAG: mechanosensitive ion channel family protein [Gemmatimonadota bacterium]
MILFFLATRLVKLLELVFRGIASRRIRLKGFHAEWARPTFKISRGLVWAFFLVVAFPYLPGSGSPAFQGVSIFLGVLLSLGGSSAVANVIAGTVLTYMRAFRIGERVKIADAVGDVVEKTMFVTRVRTVKNVVITIPNAMVMSNHIVNYSAQAETTGVTLHTTVTLGYDLPWPRVHERLVAAARATSRVEEEPAPFVLQKSLDDFTVAYELNATTREPAEMQAIYSELHQNIQNELHAAGIEIASPHLAAVRDGNRVNIPEDYLPKEYEPPAFRVLPVAVPG